MDIPKLNVEGIKNVFIVQLIMRVKKNLKNAGLLNVYTVKVIYINQIVKECEEYVRQKNIKEKMVFENISFFEASNFFPKSHSKKSNNNSNDSVKFFGKDFPNLKQKEVNNKNMGIPINQRQSTYISQNIQNKRSYTDVTQQHTYEKRRITQASKAGFNFYKELDWYANGRIPNSCPTIRNDQYIKNSNENEINNGASSSKVPDSADINQNEIKEKYNSFLKLENSKKSITRDLILTYFKLDNIKDNDNDKTKQ